MPPPPLLLVPATSTSSSSTATPSRHPPRIPSRGLVRGLERRGLPCRVHARDPLEHVALLQGRVGELPRFDFLFFAVFLPLINPKGRLDPLQPRDVVLRHQRQRPSRPPRSRSPADAVHVVGRVRRDVVVQHQVDGRNVEPSGRDVGREQQRDTRRAKGVERGEALALRERRVEGRGRDAEVGEEAREGGAALRGRAEDEGRARRWGEVIS